MKKAKKICIFLIPIVLFVLIVFFYQIQCRTIHSVIKESCKAIYIPDGVSNYYKDLLTLSIDEHKIWEYKLNCTEKNKAEQDLNNGIWDKITDKNISDVKHFFMFNSDSYFPNGISDDSYYCIYHFSLKRFVRTDELVGHSVLFVYDKENARYYCVSHSI